MSNLPVLVADQVHLHLFRGARPLSMQQLRDFGFQKVITLQSGVYEDFHDDKYEAEFAPDFGITQIHIPCSDWQAPKKHEVTKFLKAVADDTTKTYVHCLHGKDRTGFMCAVYRMNVQNWKYETAKTELMAYGFHKIPYFYWLPELKKYDKNGKQTSNYLMLE